MDNDTTVVRMVFVPGRGSGGRFLTTTGSRRSMILFEFWLPIVFGDVLFRAILYTNESQSMAESLPFGYV